ncbi:unnamed protein product [Brassica oleracea var. botrytis]|nr:hypothetical protein Bca52824_043707 [Brassica carinata]CAF1699208.1 unnamed protein product [Brassica napus]VDC88125.1 unnamed protein product [Brassica oleracea]
MSLFCPVSVATLPFRPARSPAASLQTGAQRVTFGRSHQFSRLISFSSTWALTPSSNLLSLLESEIESSVINEDAPDNDELPEWFPFQMIDRPTERVLHLTRKFGDETILVLIDRPKVPQDDEELVFGIPMGVYVSKDDDGLRLKFGVKAFADEIVIDSVAVQQRRESKWSYQGPDIDDLDENLQKAFNKFLEIRGINPTITDFLADYLANKDKREHLRWLKDVKSFVDILKLSNKSETCK